MLVYAPGLDLSIAIASNMENDDQTHPSDTLCIAYNTVKNLILGTKDKCTYTAGGYYGGNCVCK